MNKARAPKVRLDINYIIYYIINYIILFFLPISVQAAIVINEVAWMGDEDSANNEWIELYNNGEETSVEGWILTDNASLEVVLTGTLPSGYSVLERTDDGSAPGSAFLIYTGALTNGGATLTLRDETGSIQDQVAGGENWEEIGGDNTTKDTAQLTSGGWITAGATPGAENASASAVSDAELEEESTDTSSSQSSSKSSGSSNKSETIQLDLPEHELTLTIDAPKVAYVNQPVVFEVEAKGLTPVLLQSVRYRWNYGDTETGSKKTPTHTYHYPGTYVVVVEGVYAEYDGVDRHEITVLPVNFSITENEAGDIQIHNDAKYEVDLGGYEIKSGGEKLRLPKHTVLVPGGTITIPNERFEDTEAHIVTLYDAEKLAVADTVPKPVPEVAGASVSIESGVVSQVSPAPLIIAQAPSTNPEPESSNEFDQAVTTTPAVKALPATTTFNVPAEPTEDDWPFAYISLIALLGLGVVAVYLKPKTTTNE